MRHRPRAQARIIFAETEQWILRLLVAGHQAVEQPLANTVYRQHDFGRRFRSGLRLARLRTHHRAASANRAIARRGAGWRYQTAALDTSGHRRHRPPDRVRERRESDGGAGREPDTRLRGPACARCGSYGSHSLANGRSRGPRGSGRRRGSAPGLAWRTAARARGSESVPRLSSVGPRFQSASFSPRAWRFSPPAYPGFFRLFASHVGTASACRIGPRWPRAEPPHPGPPGGAPDGRRSRAARRGRPPRRRASAHSIVWILGYDRNDIFTFQMALEPAKHGVTDGATAAQFHYTPMDQLASIAGVESVGVVTEPCRMRARAARRSPRGAAARRNRSCGSPSRAGTTSRRWGFGC